MTKNLELVTLKEAAALSGRSESAIRDWLRSGKLDRHPPEEGDRYKRVRVDKAAVMARAEALNAKRQSASQSAEAPASADAPNLTAELEALKAELARKEAETAATKAKLSAQAKQHKALKAEAKALQSDLEAAKNNASSHAEQVQGLQAELADLPGQLAAKAAQAAEAQPGPSAKESKAKDDRIAALEGDLKSANGATEAERQKAKAALEQVRKLSAELDGVRADLEAAKAAGGRSLLRRLFGG
jgi:chromosome segregation ATPase